MSPSPTMSALDGQPLYNNGHHHRRQQRTESNPNSSPMPAPTSLSRGFIPRMNLGPLTTTFTPPPQCTRAVVACTGCATARVAQSCHAPISSPSVDAAPFSSGPQDDTVCWPSATSYPSSPSLAGLGFYSPGIICPTGYISACSAIRPGPPTWTYSALPSVITEGPLPNGKFQFPLIQGETAVGCCPTRYTCAVESGRGWQTCHQVVSLTKLDAITCRGEIPVVIEGFEVPFASAGTTVSQMDIYASTLR